MIEPWGDLEKNIGLTQNRHHILRFDSKEPTFEFVHFTTTSGYFFANCINVSQNLDADGHIEGLK